MNVIIKNYICWADLWLDSEPMPLEDALEDFYKLRRSYRRGLTGREPVIVDMAGNEVTVD